jgi:hypothetical protein
MPRPASPMCCVMTARVTLLRTKCARRSQALAGKVSVFRVGQSVERAQQDVPLAIDCWTLFQVL